jgi:hypothetical protein
MTATDASGPDTERKQCTLSRGTIRYLEALSKKGTHGTSVPGVMAMLIEEGVRQAIREGFVRKFEDGDAAAG